MASLSVLQLKPARMLVQPAGNHDLGICLSQLPRPGLNLWHELWKIEMGGVLPCFMRKGSMLALVFSVLKIIMIEFFRIWLRVIINKQ